MCTLVEGGIQRGGWGVSEALGWGTGSAALHEGVDGLQVLSQREGLRFRSVGWLHVLSLQEGEERSPLPLTLAVSDQLCDAWQGHYSILCRWIGLRA